MVLRPRGHDYDVPRCTDTSASRHFGTVPKCPSDISDISAPVPKCVSRTFRHRSQSHACQRRQLSSGRGGELKAVDVYVPLSLNCGF